MAGGGLGSQMGSLKRMNAILSWAGCNSRQPWKGFSQPGHSRHTQGTPMAWSHSLGQSRCVSRHWEREGAQQKQEDHVLARGTSGEVFGDRQCHVTPQSPRGLGYQGIPQASLLTFVFCCCRCPVWCLGRAVPGQGCWHELQRQEGDDEPLQQM